jgi:hypothetical protein
VIRDVVIHLQGKLPVVGDLPALPAPTDQAVLCTNLRTRDGKKPTFIDDTKGWFLIPMHEVTIVELPADAMQTSGPPIQLGGGVASSGGEASEADEQALDPFGELDSEPLEPDEDLLARIRQL